MNVRKNVRPDGLLTAYSLACGYVEKKSIGRIKVELWREHGVYHIRAHDFGEHRRLEWVVIPKLTEARKIFRRMIKEYGNEHSNG